MSKKTTTKQKQRDTDLSRKHRTQPPKRKRQPKAYNDVTGSSARVVVMQGGTRSGKTYSILKSLVAFCYMNPNGRYKIEIVRKTFVSLAESSMEDFFEILHNEGYYNEKNHNKQRNTYNLFGNTIKFSGIDQAARKRGPKRDILFINEANELTWDEFFQLNIRTRMKTIIDFNPSMDEQHWIFTRVVPRMDADTFITTYRDNPYLSKSEVREIEMLKDVDQYYWEVFGQGRNAKNPAQIFHATNIIGIPEDATLIGHGLDFGFASSPTCLISVWKRVVKDDTGDVLFNDIIIHELVYGTGLTNAELNEKMKLAEVPKTLPIYADSEDPKSIAELRAMGWRVIGTKKPRDGIQWGIQYINQHRLFITSGSSNVERDFRLYKFKQDKQTGENTNDPLKAYDHGPDAARYVVISKSYKGKYKVQ